MKLYYYIFNGQVFASRLPQLPLPAAQRPAPQQNLGWLFDRPPEAGRAAFCVSDQRQLTAPEEDVAFLAPNRLPPLEGSLPQRLLRQIRAGTLQAVNIRHPQAAFAQTFPRTHAGKRRVHLLAAGDVGGTLLTGLKLLGGDCISALGVCDLREETVRRWVAELGQVSWPWDYDALPPVEAVSEEELFACDVLLFAASRAVPPVGSAVQDVRMAQLEANRAIVEQYAQKARERHFRGLFIVLSDPVDPLCRAAYLASNRNERGEWDGLGLLPEQIQGFGLGVMNARAADLARREPAYASFLEDGRCFGPHGQGLVVANSLSRYDDAVSRQLTQQVLSANLRIRELGFKPYVAPALSSGAFQLLLLLRGQWHCGSVCLGGQWIGCRNRYTVRGLETEALELPDALYERLLETQQTLRQIV